MIKSSEIRKIKDEISIASASHQDLKSWISSASASATLSFHQSLRPSTPGIKRYLVVLCPELNYPFISSLFGGPVGSSFTIKSITASLSSMLGIPSDATLSFLEPKNLSVRKSQDINRFLNTMVRISSPLSERDFNAVLDLDTTHDASGKEYETPLSSLFEAFGSKNPLLRDLSQNALCSSPILKIPTPNQAVIFNSEIKANRSYFVLSDSENQVYGVPTSVSELGKSDFGFHILGAFLIQFPIPEVEAATALILNWNLCLEYQKTQKIVFSTADKVLGYTLTNSNPNPNPKIVVYYTGPYTYRQASSYTAVRDLLKRGYTITLRIVFLAETIDSSLVDNSGIKISVLFAGDGEGTRTTRGTALSGTSQPNQKYRNVYRSHEYSELIMQAQFLEKHISFKSLAQEDLTFEFGMECFKRVLCIDGDKRSPVYNQVPLQVFLDSDEYESQDGTKANLSFMTSSNLELDKAPRFLTWWILDPDPRRDPQTGYESLEISAHLLSCLLLIALPIDSCFLACLLLNRNLNSTKTQTKNSNETTFGQSQ